MNKGRLIDCFEQGIEDEFEFMGILRETPSGEEIIIFNKKDFVKKKEFYQKAYTNDLTYCTDDRIKILKFTLGVLFEEIEENLYSKF